MSRPDLSHPLDLAVSPGAVRGRPLAAPAPQRHRIEVAGPAGTSGRTSTKGSVLVLLAAVIGLVVLPAAGSAAVKPTSKPTSKATSAGATGVLDLSDWYLTLPTGKRGNPDTVHQPDLGRYSSAWFHLDDGKDGVVFTADAGGVTTSGSSYPRSELREMNGSKKASWSSTSGTHTLSVRQAVMALPKAKPDVVTAQIHDTASDVLEVRLEGTKLIAQYDDGRTDVTLDPHYTLGTPYDLKIVAAGGRIQVSYNGTKKVDISKKGSGWYFKSGSYLQSNTSKGDKANAVGVVVIYQLDVSHSS